nr:immunoglobulin heavy chain junction region [Mus musculus]
CASTTVVDYYAMDYW